MPGLQPLKPHFFRWYALLAINTLLRRVVHVSVEINQRSDLLSLKLFGSRSESNDGATSNHRRSQFLYQTCSLFNRPTTANNVVDDDARIHFALIHVLAKPASAFSLFLGPIDLLGAERVIAIDHFPARLELAAKFGAETINFEHSKVYEALQDMTGGVGPDASIDCVGLEAHGLYLDNVLDQIKVSTFLGTDRGHVIRQIIMATRKGGNVSIPGVYGGFLDKFPLGAMMEKGLTVKTGQTHVQKYTEPLYAAIVEDKIDTTFLISHRMPLEAGPEGYQKLHDEQDTYTKIVLKPGMAAAA